MEIIFYRYEAVQYVVHDVDGELILPEFPNPTVKLKKYDMLKETPKGYWIGDKHFPEVMYKWISKTSKKKFAYPTKQDALLNFIRRTQKRIKILEYQIIFCKMALNVTERIKQ